MLIEFLVENFRSIKNICRFSMLSTKSSTLPNHRVMFKFGRKKIYVNKLGILFGSNASGKSNILLALAHMYKLVPKLGICREDQSRLKASYYDPFRFSSENRKQPTLLQSSFIIDKTYYRYGFKYDSSGIKSEWLYSGSPFSEKLIFYRSENLCIDYGDNFSELQELKSAEKHLKTHNLLLSVGADLKINICEKVIQFFVKQTLPPHRFISLSIFLNEEIIPILTSMLLFADIGIEKIEKRVEKLPEMPALDALPKGLRDAVTALRDYVIEQDPQKETIIFKHNVQNMLEDDFSLLPEENESTGTKAFLRVLVFLCLAIKKQSVIIIDEIDSSLHPLLVAAIIKFFTSVEGSQAQLICASHCPFIFSQKIVRRDELWIAEKDKDGQSILCSASDYIISKSSNDITHQYLDGQFGGVPLLNEDILKVSCKAAEKLISNNSESITLSE